MASPGSLCIVIGAGGLAVLGQADAEPQHQMTQQRPAHAARISSFLGCSRGLPGPSSPPSASGALVESLCSCSSGEITLSRARTPQTPRHLFAHPGAHGRSLSALRRSGHPAWGSLSKTSQKELGQAWEKRVLGFSPTPTPHTPHTTPPSPGNICGSSGHFLLACYSFCLDDNPAFLQVTTMQGS